MALKEAMPLDNEVIVDDVLSENKKLFLFKIPADVINFFFFFLFHRSVIFNSFDLKNKSIKLI